MRPGLTIFRGKFQHPKPLIDLTLSHVCHRPAVRDMLVEFPEKYSFEEFSDVYSSNVTVSWPHDESDIQIDLSGMYSPGHVTQAMVNPIFERHIRNLDNWTVGEGFRRFYPEMYAAVSSRY